MAQGVSGVGAGATSDCKEGGEGTEAAGVGYGAEAAESRWRGRQVTAETLTLALN